LPEPLDRIALALERAATVVEPLDIAAREEILGQIQAVLARLGATADTLTADMLAAIPGTPDAELLAEWLHALRSPAAAIVGWVQLLSLGHDRDARRAREGVARNVRTLLVLLAHPPGSAGSGPAGAVSARSPEI